MLVDNRFATIHVENKMKKFRSFDTVDELKVSNWRIFGVIFSNYFYENNIFNINQSNNDFTTWKLRCFRDDRIVQTKANMHFPSD